MAKKRSAPKAKSPRRRKASGRSTTTRSVTSNRTTNSGIGVGGAALIVGAAIAAVMILKPKTATAGTPPVLPPPIMPPSGGHETGGGSGGGGGASSSVLFGSGRENGAGQAAPSKALVDRLRPMSAAAARAIFAFQATAFSFYPELTADGFKVDGLDGSMTQQTLRTLQANGFYPAGAITAANNREMQAQLNASLRPGRLLPFWLPADLGNTISRENGVNLQEYPST